MSLHMSRHTITLYEKGVDEFGRPVERPPVLNCYDSPSLKLPENDPYLIYLDECIDGINRIIAGKMDKREKAPIPPNEPTSLDGVQWQIWEGCKKVTLLYQRMRIKALEFPPREANGNWKERV